MLDPLGKVRKKTQRDQKQGLEFNEEEYNEIDNYWQIKKN